MNIPKSSRSMLLFILLSITVASLIAGLLYAGTVFLFAGAASSLGAWVLYLRYYFGKEAPPEAVVQETESGLTVASTQEPPVNRVKAALDNTFQILPVLTAQLEAVIGQTDQAADGLSTAFIGISQQAKKQLASVEKLYEQLSCNGSDTRSIAGTQGRLQEIQSNFVRVIQFLDTLLNRFNDVTTSLAKINDIAVKIEKISDTTDILAINAAIEAHTAGDAGAGFNVIATEIKVLSRDSNEAITQISELIASLTANVAGIQQEIEVVRNEAHSINTSTGELFTQTTESLRTIIDETAAKVQELSSDAAALTNDIGMAVVSIQFQDITRQRIEHVIEPLATIGKDAVEAVVTVLEAAGGEGESPVGKNNAADLLMKKYTMESEREMLNNVIRQK